jgi:hypothetical protein
MTRVDHAQLLGLTDLHQVSSCIISVGVLLVGVLIFLLVLCELKILAWLRIAPCACLEHSHQLQAVHANLVQMLCTQGTGKASLSIL